MKYENVKDILPSHIIEILQEYIDGKYLYIPRKSNSKKSVEFYINRGFKIIKEQLNDDSGYNEYIMEKRCKKS